MTVNADDFKQALQRWASGVTVVTCDSPTHGLLGMTATSFASVSMEPPQILVCVNDSALTAAGIVESGHFTVNILSTDQQSLSNLFAGGASHADRFSTISWSRGVHESPVLEQSIAALECKLVNQIRAGSHWIMVGQVDRVSYQSGKPLLYFKAGYRSLGIQDNMAS